MRLMELKKSIERGSVGHAPIFMLSKDGGFVASQYIKAIAKLNGLRISYVDSLDGLCSQEADLFGYSAKPSGAQGVLQVLITDKLVGPIPFGIEGLTDLFVSFSSADPEAIRKLDGLGILTEVPALKDWQVLDYMKSVCVGLGTDKLRWLYSIAKGNVFRLSNESEKIGVFPKDEQEEVFRDLNESDGYADLSSLTIFNLTNGIMKKDRDSVKEVLLGADGIDIEGVGLVTILSRSVRNVIEIQMGSGATPESTGMSPKQFRAVGYECGRFSDAKLMSMYDFLLGFDLKLKSGGIDLDNGRMIDYIVCELLS